MSKSKIELTAMSLTQKAVWNAFGELGIYPAAVRGEGGYEKRTEFQEGWNAAQMEFIGKISSAFKTVGCADDNLALLLIADVGHLYDGEFYLNMNDTFYYACADSEPVPSEKIAQVADLFKRYGYRGLNYWVAEQRGHDPQIEKYRKQVESVRQQEQERSSK